jgi:hypothetical protein
MKKHFNITIATARRYEDGTARIEFNENYISNRRDEELTELLDEFTEIFNNTKNINGHELYPDFIHFGGTENGYCRCTSYPAARKEAE